MTEAEFQKNINARRHELLNKKHDTGFTEEEKNRPFADHPGWEEECKRRHQANLTEAEHAELEQLQKACGDYLNEAYPLPPLPDLNKLREEIRKELPELVQRHHDRMGAKDAKEGKCAGK